ncbi:MAG: PriCT-2 domain-containing protein [Bacteroidota bacterium]|nr:PriCT-2 domain-containing protein [Bacteroidota bacterium]
MSKITYTDNLCWKGSKPFLTCNEAELVKRLKNKETTYEVILDDIPCKLYFDIDYELPKEEFNDEVALMVEKKSKEYVLKALDELIPDVKPNIAMATSHTKNLDEKSAKYSVRYFISNIKTTKSSNSNLVHKLNEFVQKKADPDNIYDYIDEELSPKLFDEGIYDHNRKMRCLNTSKPNQNRPLLLKEGTYENTIITGCFDEICYDFVFEPQVRNRKINIIENNTMPFPVENVEKTQLFEYCDLIALKYLDYYPDWIKIIMTLKILDQKEIARHVSKKSKKYDDNYFENLWNKLDTKYAYTIATLYYYAKLSNPDAKRDLDIKFQVFLKAETICKGLNDVAKFIKPYLNQNLKYSNEKWYSCDKNTSLWRENNEPTSVIVNTIQNKVDEAMAVTIHLKCNEEDEEKKSLYGKLIKIYTEFYCNVCKEASTLKKFLMDYLYDKEFYKNLDNNPDKLAFKNGMYDLRNGNFDVGFKPEDLITETIPYPYQPHDNAKLVKLRSILKEILNNNDQHLEYFLSIIGYTFLGRANLEKSIYFCIDGTKLGKGDNGKTFWFDILTDLMPCYVYKTKNTLLEDGNTKTHKQLVKCKGKRLVWLDEFTEKKAKADLMKELADGKTTENEIMFGTSEMIQIMFKLFILSNHPPTIDPKEEAVYNRYKQISYGSHFDRTGCRKEPNPEKLEFIADIGLKDKIMTEYVNEVFALVIQYARKYFADGIPPIPDKFKKDTDEVKKNNDAFGIWFNENCEIVDDDSCRVSVKKLCSYSGMSEKLVKEGMKRKGLDYDRNLRFTKFTSTRGGYKYVKINEEENDG